MDKLQRISHFRSLGLGMFVHYGLYSILGKGEWVQYYKNIKGGEYAALIERFEPKKDWATELVAMAKKLGFRYITLTTRHHDGFSLYDANGLSDFDAPHSKCKRDLIAEFTDAASKEGVIPFFYHTLIDWRHEANFSSFDDYLQFLRLSIKLLCTKYGKIGGFWFDGMWQYPNYDWHEDELYAIIRKHQPDAMIINNTGLIEQGKLGHSEIDGVTFERGCPMPSNIAGEVCESLNDTWGYSDEDIMFKSPLEHIKNIAKCRSLGCNYLLNVGPLFDGSIGKIEQGLLDKVGLWVNMHDEAIFNARPSVIKPKTDNAVITENDDFYYIFCFDVPMGANPNVTIVRPISQIRTEKFDYGKAIWMDNGEQIELSDNDGETILPVVPFPYGTSLGVRVAKIFKN